MKTKLVLETSADEKGHYRHTNVRDGSYVRSEIIFFCVEMADWSKNGARVTDIDGVSTFNEEEWRTLLREDSQTFTPVIIARRWQIFVDEKLWR